MQGNQSTISEERVIALEEEIKKLKEIKEKDKADITNLKA